MKVTISGASGFLGRRLVQKLMAEGHGVNILGRSRKPGLPAGASFFAWDVMKNAAPTEAFENTDAVIHLAGEPVAQRWTDDAKLKILESRSVGTLHLVQGLAKLTGGPKVLVCASAIGYYGDCGDEVLTETRAPGAGFLADVCVEWERQAAQAEQLGMRVAMIRIGIVLGEEGGALKAMLPAFRMGVGGKLGSGRQWMSWIHADDLVDLFIFAATRRELRGPVNGVSPNPVRNEEFTKQLAQVLHKPAAIRVPAFGLKLLLGEMSSMLLASQRVQPGVAESSEFRFNYPALADALRSACGQRSKDQPN